MSDFGTHPPWFVRQFPKDTRVFEGEQLELRTSIAGSPLPDVWWFRDGFPVAEDDYRTVEFGSGGTCCLVFHYVRDLDEGEYECRARNCAGQVSCFGELQVQLIEKDRYVDASEDWSPTEDIPCEDIEGRQSGLFILIDEGSQDEEEDDFPKGLATYRRSISASEQIEGIIEDLTMAEGTASISLSREGVFMSDESQDDLTEDKEFRLHKYKCLDHIPEDESDTIHPGSSTTPIPAMISATPPKSDDTLIATPSQDQGLANGSFRQESTEGSTLSTPASGATLQPQPVAAESVTSEKPATETIDTAAATRSWLKRQESGASRTSSIDAEGPLQITELLSPTDTMSDHHPIVREESEESVSKRMRLSDALERQTSVSSGVKITELDDDTIREEEELEEDEEESIDVRRMSTAPSQQQHMEKIDEARTPLETESYETLRTENTNLTTTNIVPDDAPNPSSNEFSTQSPVRSTNSPPKLVNILASSEKDDKSEKNGKHDYKEKPEKKDSVNPIAAETKETSAVKHSSVEPECEGSIFTKGSQAADAAVTQTATVSKSDDNGHVRFANTVIKDTPGGTQERTSIITDIKDDDTSKSRSTKMESFRESSDDGYKQSSYSKMEYEVKHEHITEPCTIEQRIHDELRRFERSITPERNFPSSTLGSRLRDIEDDFFSFDSKSKKNTKDEDFAKESKFSSSKHRTGDDNNIFDSKSKSYSKKEQSAKEESTFSSSAYESYTKGDDKEFKSDSKSSKHYSKKEHDDTHEHSFSSTFGRRIKDDDDDDFFDFDSKSKTRSRKDEERTFSPSSLERRMKEDDDGFFDLDWKLKGFRKKDGQDDTKERTFSPTSMFGKKTKDKDDETLDLDTSSPYLVQRRLLGHVQSESSSIDEDALISRIRSVREQQLWSSDSKIEEGLRRAKMLKDKLEGIQATLAESMKPTPYEQGRGLSWPSSQKLWRNSSEEEMSTSDRHHSPEHSRDENDVAKMDAHEGEADDDTSNIDDETINEESLIENYEEKAPVTNLPLDSPDPAGMSFTKSFESYSYTKTADVVEQSFEYNKVSSSSTTATSNTKTLLAVTESYDTDDSKSEPVFDLYVAIADYIPDGADPEAIPLWEGQIVEVLDSHSSQKWMVRTRPTKTSSSKQGWVPPSYLEKKTLSTTLRSIQDILEMEADSKTDSKEKEAIRKRAQAVKELVETEEEFAKDMLHVVNTYVRDLENTRVPKEIRDLREAIFMNFSKICDFHNNVLIKGVQYYANEPARLGKTFLRLERDFDMHVNYCRDEPKAQQLLTVAPAKEYFQQYSQRIGEVDKTLADHLKLPIQRINDYQLLLKELIKYSARLKEDCTDLQKALDLMLSIPQRASDLKFLNSIEGYRGNLLKLGRLLRHDWFTISDSDGKSKERYLFLFKARVLVCKVKRINEERSIFILKDIVRLPDVEIKDRTGDKCKFELHHKDAAAFPRYPLTLIAKTEFSKEAWLKEIREFAHDVVDFGEEEIEVEPDRAHGGSTGDELEVYEELITAPTDESVRSESVASMDAKKGKPGKKPAFSKPLKPKSFKPGDSVSLECDVLSVPPATVLWLKDNMPLSQSDRLQFVTKGDHQVLSLKGAQAGDAGLYTAHAVNSAGTATSSAHLSLLDVPKEEDERPTTPGGTILPHAPIFSIKFKDTELLEDSSVTFMVKVRALPEAEVKFLKDGKDLKVDDHIKIVAEDKETFELVISHIKPGDAGKYSCFAKNSLGEATTDANVTVSSEKSFVGFKVGEEVKTQPAEPGEEPTFTWYRDGQEFEASERFKVMFKDEEDTLALVFQHVKPEDAGMYTCVAATTSGNISCSAELTVQGGVQQLMREPAAPKITAELTDTEVNAGGSAMLELKVTGFPKPAVTWSKDGKAVEAGGRFRILHEDEESIALVIKNVVAEDSGKYKVVAKNNLGESSTSANLLVKAPPTFKKAPTDVTAMVSQEVRLEVQIEGKPVPEVTWFKDGQAVKASDRIKVVQEKDGIFALIIKKSTSEDSGSYSCVASNNSGKISEFCKVSVSVPPSFLKEFKNTECRETENVKLEVKVDGTPPPTVTWSRDGEQLKTDGKHIKIEQDDRNHCLIIEKVTRKESAKYSCTVTNTHGSSTCSGNLTVNCIPEFSAKLSDRTVKEGDEDVKLEVKLSGTPEPALKWYIDKMEITEKSNNFKMVSDGETKTLIIKKVAADCAGKITCQAKNSIGEVNVSATLNVLTTPKFTEKLSDKEVTEGDTVVYQVKVTGNPEPQVKWYKNNQEVSVDAKIKIKHESSETWTLTLDHVSGDTSGEYECRAKNSEGESASKSKLIVNTKPTFEKGLSDLDAWIGLEAVIEVKINGVPDPEVKWTKDGQPLAASNRVKIEKDGKTHRIVMKESAVEDSGAYSCTIKNKIGENKTEGKLRVKTPTDANEPVCIKQLAETVSVRYSPATFEAKILGNPKPDTVWKKDGKDLAEGERIHLTEVPEQFTYRLTVEKTNVADMGKYSIHASNGHGKISSEASLDVRVPPELEAPMDRQIMPKGNTTYEVTVTGRPQPAVTWCRNGKPLSQGAKFSWTGDDKKQKYVLTITGADLEDAGEYEVVGENIVGKAKQSFKLLITTDAPKFTQVITSILVKPMKMAQFDTAVDGIPIPGVKWFRNGNELTPNYRINFVQNDERSHSLKIDEFCAEDVGDYECQAVSQVGTASCKARLDVLHTMPFFPKHVPKETCAIDGESFTLEAKVDGSPHPSVKWLKDGKPVEASDRIKLVVLPDGTCKLTVDNANAADCGKYTLVATNETGELSSTGVVTVEAVPKAPSITEKLKKKTVNEGSPLQLSAKITGYPRPVIKWFKDGKPVKLDRCNLAEKPDGCVALVIDEAKPEDAGKYSLHVKNNLGEASSEADVLVQSPPQAPFFPIKLRHMDVYEGYPIRLEGKVGGYPLPALKWLKNGSELKPDGQRIIASLQPDGILCLTVNAVMPEDSGKYTCVATNSEGEATSFSDVAVISRTKAGEPIVAPSFVTPLRDTVLDENLPLKLQAHVAGNPVPQISWSKDGQPLKSDDRLLIAFDGDRVSIDIKKVNTGDAGKYECRLENKEGTATSVSDVKIKKVSRAPIFTQRFPDLTVILAQDARFVCRATGLPNPDITWYHNDKPLAESDKYKMKHEGDMFALYVRDCTTKDIGNITCRASNIDGEEKCTAFLNVVDKLEKKEKTEPPSFLKKLADCEVIEGMGGKFTACVSGFPEPEFKWYKDGRELVQTDKIKFEVDAHGLLRLILKNVQPQDVGKYKLRIINPHGEAECEASLRSEGHEKKAKKPMADYNADFEKIKRSGVPFALPDKPIISKMTDRRLTLSWKPSIPVGPRVPVTYIVEMCEVPDGDWFNVRTGVRSCCCEIHNLEPFRDYKFRIRVENKYGISDPSPYATAYRTKLEMTPPKYLPTLPSELDFRPETSQYFPKDYDPDKSIHEAYAHAPRFLRQASDFQYGVKNQPSNVQWFVYGFPMPTITWYFGEEKIEMGGRYDSAFARNAQATLFINRMLERDVGIYECVAINEHGEARQRVQVEIAEPPVFSMQLDETTVLLRDKCCLQCRVVGTPYPEIKWYKDWHPLADSSRTKIEWKEPDLCTLTINDTISKDAGLYSCAARNLAGMSSNSVMVTIEENEGDYSILTYNRNRVVKARHKPFEDMYDIGDELGRGTQGIIYHAVERATGNSLAAKIMHGKGELRDAMDHELDIMNQLHSRHLIRAIDGFDTKKGLTLITELAAGGELLDSLCKQTTLKESDIAMYIRQVLWGLDHMHNKGIAHLGLTPGDLLLSKPGGDDIKICDFGLARRLIKGKDAYLDYGMPEFVAPEVANRKPISFQSDMWSVGVITYLLLSGISPFLGDHDRQTLQQVQQGKLNFDQEVFTHISAEAKDFMSKLLVFEASGRLDVKAALKHPWLKWADRPGAGESYSTESLKSYYRRYRDWCSNSACKRFYRRRPLESAFTHPSRMVYPPDEQYTPASSPEPSPTIRTKGLPTFKDKVDREHENYDLGFADSESRYQAGPDTYLLQLRDVGFPLRLREYMRVGATTSPMLGFRLMDTMLGKAVTVRERRRFTDVMDEEIDEEKKGICDSTQRRITSEVAPRSETKNRIKELMPYKQDDGQQPFFREKLQDQAIVEDQLTDLTCFIIGDPKPNVQWYRNDVILSETHRIKFVETPEGRSILRFAPSRAFDAGIYKAVARNASGESSCRARLRLGDVPGRPDAPEVSKVSDTEALLKWNQPKDTGNSTIGCYELEYKEKESNEWKLVSSAIDHDFFVVRGLKPRTLYHYRLRAQNKFGFGEFSVPSASTRTMDEGVEKISVSIAMKHLQEITEAGRTIDYTDTEQQTLRNYNVEQEPIALTQAAPTDKYSFVAEIARGQFSVVVKASKTEGDVRCAAKIIDASKSEARAQQEVETMRALCHERLPVLLESFHYNNMYILVMEKLQGYNVLTFLTQRHEYNEELITRMVSQVLDALQYLHVRRTVHLDLQPDNIVVSNLQQADFKLVDLGSAHKVGRSCTVTLETKPGLLDYRAPEVINGEEVTCQADLWSLGVLTYILLSGVSPFVGNDEKETCENITYVRYRFENLFKEVTSEATRFVMLLFKKTPAKRPTADECLECVKWLNPSDLMLKKRQRAIFLSSRLKPYADEYHRKRSQRPSCADALLGSFGEKFGRSVSIECDAPTTF